MRHKAKPTTEESKMIILKVKRENGQIEEVEAKFAGMNDILFAKIKKATADAGKGDVLSWSDVDTRSEEEKAAQKVSDMYAKAETLRDSDPEACIKMIMKADEAKSKLAKPSKKEAAKIVAKEFSAAENDQKSSAGSKALKRIEAGEDFDQVISEMKQEWSVAASKLVENS